MEKIVANIPEILSAANSITGYIEQFRDEKAKTIQASQELSEGWEGTAAQKYLERMNEFTGWMEQMATVLEDYPQVLKETTDKYRITDKW